MNARFLIADDDADIREFLSVLLCRKGADVVSVTSGKQLHQKLLEEPFDLVVADVVMPGMSGIQVLQLARKDDIGTPFLIISSMHTTELEDLVRSFSSAAFLRKPFSANSLLAAVDKMLAALPL